MQHHDGDHGACAVTHIREAEVVAHKGPLLQQLWLGDHPLEDGVNDIFVPSSQKHAEGYPERAHAAGRGVAQRKDTGALALDCSQQQGEGDAKSCL